MSNDGSKQGAPWPVPSKLFSVDIGNTKNISFKNVQGLSIKYDVVEYRGGTNMPFSNVKMPLGQMASDVRLIRGMFAYDSTIWDWFSQVKLNTIKRETVSIKLLGQENNVLFTWQLINAFPKEITFGELDAMANAIAIEELVVACERIDFSVEKTSAEKS